MFVKASIFLALSFLEFNVIDLKANCLKTIRDVGNSGTLKDLFLIIFGHCSPNSNFGRTWCSSVH